MGIKEITKGQFDADHSKERAGLNFILEELEWYADDAENVTGVLLRDRADNDFGFVILGRDEDSLRGAIDIEHSFATVKAARDRLQERMTEREASGQTVFPQ